MEPALSDRYFTCPAFALRMACSMSTFTVPGPTTLRGPPPPPATPGIGWERMTEIQFGCFAGQTTLRYSSQSGVEVAVGSDSYRFNPLLETPGDAVCWAMLHFRRGCQLGDALQFSQAFVADPNPSTGGHLNASNRHPTRAGIGRHTLPRAVMRPKGGGGPILRVGHQAPWPQNLTQLQRNLGGQAGESIPDRQCNTANGTTS